MIIRVSVLSGQGLLPRIMNPDDHPGVNGGGDDDGGGGGDRPVRRGVYLSVDIVRRKRIEKIENEEEEVNTIERRKAHDDVQETNDRQHQETNGGQNEAGDESIVVGGWTTAIQSESFTATGVESRPHVEWNQQLVFPCDGTLNEYIMEVTVCEVAVYCSQPAVDRVVGYGEIALPSRSELIASKTERGVSGLRRKIQVSPIPSHAIHVDIDIASHIRGRFTWLLLNNFTIGNILTF